MSVPRSAAPTGCMQESGDVDCSGLVTSGWAFCRDLFVNDGGAVRLFS